MRRIGVGLVLALPALFTGPLATSEAGPPTAGEQAGDRDPRAVEIAERVLERLGGREAWEATRFITWDFFEVRRHVWDRWTGDLRIESEDRTVLMNLNTRKGKVFAGTEEIVDPEARREALDAGYAWWINDSYWMFMPFKMLDPGVRLAYRGEGTMEDGREADVLELTFGEGVGLTPRNRYQVFVARDTGLVEQWDFYADAADEEPRFKIPWAGWRRFGRIWLSTDKGRDKSWRIAVFDELPRSVFESPEPLAF